MFGSWWFVLITVLLFVSLVACLIPRTRALIRALRARPVQAREIDAFRHYGERTVAAPPSRALDGSARVLRRRFFRVARDPSDRRWRAEKGVLRELGSLLFHWAFILILVGVVYGKGTGFSGYAVVVEGDTWIDAAANYDGQIRTGRFFDGDFTGYGPSAPRVRECVPRDGSADGFRLAGGSARPRGVAHPPAGHPREPSRRRERHPLLSDQLRVGARAHEFAMPTGWRSTTPW